MIIFTLVLIGLFAGLSAGLFGLGGGIIIVPALVHFLGFSQHQATGTSLAVLLPPIGLAAAYTYYQNGNVDISSALVIAISMFCSGYLGALIANSMRTSSLEIAFGAFLLVLAVYTISKGVANRSAENQLATGIAKSDIL